MTGQLAPLDVVLVEDHDEVREAQGWLLRASGAKVTAFAFAQAALEHIELHGADLVVTDLDMPGLDGVEFIVALQRRGIVLPIWLLSARSVSRSQARLNEAGARPVHAVLEKPLTLATLRSMLGTLPERRARPAGWEARVPRYPRWAFPEASADQGALEALSAYWARQHALTKPLHSLGRLEHLGAQLAALQRAPVPACRPASALLFISDHPVADLGVSAYPMVVTRAMVGNFATGGAAASVLCRLHHLPLKLVDVGVHGGAVDVTPHGDVSYHRAACAELPVGNLVGADAMPAATFLAAIDAGRQAVEALPADTRMVIVGEMGIGNSTCAAAVCTALFGATAEAFVGPGTGVTGDALANKVRVVDEALARARRNYVDLHNGLEVLRVLGGRDLAAMLGAMAAAVERRIAVLVDGYIATAAALALVRVAPLARAGLVFAHASREPGHTRALELLGIEPLMRLDLALGEGSGALVAWPVVEAACTLVREMATFSSAAVPERVR